jgi:hypothetical protein
MLLLLLLLLLRPLTAGWWRHLPRDQVDVLELVHNAGGEDVHGLGQEQQPADSPVNGSLLLLRLMMAAAAAVQGCLAAVHHDCNVLQVCQAPGANLQWPVTQPCRTC